MSTVARRTRSRTSTTAAAAKAAPAGPTTAVMRAAGGKFARVRPVAVASAAAAAAATTTRGARSIIKPEPLVLPPGAFHALVGKRRFSCDGDGDDDEINDEDGPALPGSAPVSPRADSTSPAFDASVAAAAAAAAAAAVSAKGRTTIRSYRHSDVPERRVIVCKRTGADSPLQQQQDQTMMKVIINNDLCADDAKEDADAAVWRPGSAYSASWSLCGYEFEDATLVHASPWALKGTATCAPLAKHVRVINSSFHVASNLGALVLTSLPVHEWSIRVVVWWSLSAASAKRTELASNEFNAAIYLPYVDTSSGAKHVAHVPARATLVKLSDTNVYLDVRDAELLESRLSFSCHGRSLWA